LRSAACLALELRPCRLPRVVPPAHGVRLAYPLLLHNTVPGTSVPVSTQRTPRANAAPVSGASLRSTYCSVRVVPGRRVCPRRASAGHQHAAVSLRSGPLRAGCPRSP
jgi:hypothetical protein